MPLFKRLHQVQPGNVRSIEGPPRAVKGDSYTANLDQIAAVYDSEIVRADGKRCALVAFAGAENLLPAYETRGEIEGLAMPELKSLPVGKLARPADPAEPAVIEKFFGPNT